MRPWAKRFTALAGLLVCAALAAGGWYLARALPIGTGYAAKHIGSSRFISGRDDETVFREDILLFRETGAKMISFEVSKWIH